MKIYEEDICALVPSSCRYKPDYPAMFFFLWLCLLDNHDGLGDAFSLFELLNGSGGPEIVLGLLLSVSRSFCGL